MSNKLILRKIELKMLIDTLVEVYNTGADYIDIEGSTGDSQDVIGIIVHPEYMSEQDNDIFDEDLSDEDLNQLI